MTDLENCVALPVADESAVPQYTPGPWKQEDRGWRVTAKDTKGEFPICDIRGWGHLTGKGHGALGLSHEDAIAIQEANAHLIAAAPEMYEALEELADLMQGIIEGDYTPDSFTLQPALAALRKARGEQ